MTAVDPFAIREIERPTSSGGAVHPQRLMWHQMHAAAQQRTTDEETALRRVEDEKHRLAELICHLAALNHQLAGLAVRLEDLLEEVESPGIKEVAEALVALVAKGDRAMTNAGATVLYHATERYTPEVAELMELLESIPTEGLDSQKVRETTRPGVLLDGELVQRSQVILSIPAAAESQEAPRNEPSLSHVPSNP